jgi:type VI secretion system protein ImpF
VTRVDSQHGLEPSILDRLVPQEPLGLVRWEGSSLEQMIEAVRRDLEDLLNTRQTQGDLPACYEELTRSVFTFGVPDASSLSAMTQERRGEMGRLIGGLIERFEPRLRDVQVRLTDSDPLGREIRFHIEARLPVEPYPEVGFETVLDVSTGHAVIAPGEA